MKTLVTLSPESVEAVARRVVELQSEATLPSDPNPWLTREQAERYLGFSRTMFLVMRQKHPVALAPVSEKPLRWSRNALDVFKMSAGAPAMVRRGRPRKAA